jgi:ABC-type microcin C transport system duplicated ATPase subunit YejF
MLVVTDGGSLNVDDGETLRIIGGAGITTSMSGNNLVITDTSSQGSEVFSTQLEFGDIVPNIQSHAEFLQLNFDLDYGTITAPVTFGSDMGTIL